MVTPLDSAGNSFTSFEDRKIITTSISCYYVDTSMKSIYGYAPTNVVTEVLNRNSQWENCLVVTDVTGSMYPYLAQFLLWHQKNLDIRKGNHDFVFFNDGDNIRDDLKIVGKVGGIYYKKTALYDTLKSKMSLAMQSGFGGDGPENNIEAILFGLEKYPNCKEVILIADNFASPCDMKLLQKIKVPVHVILCGANSINVEYIKIAKKTKGSIHTIEQDLYNLDKLSFTEDDLWISIDKK